MPPTTKPTSGQPAIDGNEFWTDFVDFKRPIMPISGQPAMNENTPESGPCSQCGTYIEHVENCFCARPPQLFECHLHEDAEDSFYLVGCHTCGTYFFGHTPQFAFQHWNVNMAPEIVNKPANQLFHENTPESGPCPVCGADECVGHDFPHISEETEFCPNCGWTSEPASDLPRWKAILYSLHISDEDFYVFLCFILFSISFSIFSFFDSVVQPLSISERFSLSLMFSVNSFMLFILFRSSVRFLRRKLDSMSNEQ
jgi:hypothetical protein